MSESNKKEKKPGQWRETLLRVLSIAKKVWMVLFTTAKVALGAAATVLLICVVCGFAFMGVLGDYLQDDIVAQAAGRVDLGDLDMELSSYTYYINEEGNIDILQQVFAATSRQWAKYEDIPKDMVHAAIAIEDKRFYEHQGVDWITTIKACARMFFGDDSVGGSSITQQLVKNATREDSVTVQRKVLEIFSAVDLERRYSKEDIMEYYLNLIYLGQGCGGVRSAAATYFGKELEMLTTAECASIISITNNPSLYDPYMAAFQEGGRTGKERNRSRQLLVLQEMRNQGWITEAEYKEAVDQEMVFKNGIDPEDRLAHCPNETCGYSGTVGTYPVQGGELYCPKCQTIVDIENDASRSVYSWFVDTALEDVARDLAKKDGAEWNDTTYDLYMKRISSGGYHIFTTMDKKAQDQVDKIYTNLKELPATYSGQQFQSAIVLLSNETGDIIAMAGAMGEKTDHDAFSFATDETLQSGSSIKPLSIYAPGFESGVISPATVIKDLPFTYSGGAWPANDNRQYNYSRTVWSGVVNSVNAVATNTLDKIGLEYGYEFAKEKFRLHTLVEEYTDSSGKDFSDIDYAPLAMGAQTRGVTVRDMSSAFATFANNGVYRKARTYTKVYDSDGNLVLDNAQESEQILSQKAVNYMNYCLTNAVSQGTGGEAYLGSTSVAGKTGTTAQMCDRWFCGFTDYYTAAVWCGYKYPEVIRFVNYSGNPSALMWKKVMAPLHSGLPWRNLYSSSGMTTVEVCLDSGKLATAACKNDVRGKDLNRVSEVMVYPEDIPAGKCTMHVEVDYCTSGDGVSTEWCNHFAEVDETVKIEKKALVKLTLDDMEEILKAKPYNLKKLYYTDEYVYMVDAQGRDANYKGFLQTINKNVKAPYKVCTVHTQEAWEKYQQENPSEPTGPNNPNNPGGPNNPNSGNIPH